MLTFATVLLVSIAVIFCYVTGVFLLSLAFKRNDVADIAWGIGIVLVGVVSYLLQEVQTERMQLLLILVSFWGLRLAIRIFLRNRKKGEDARYRTWREEWGKNFVLRSYLQVFLLQGALMVLVAYPLIHTSAFGMQEPLGYLAILGVLLWTVGFIFEVVGDYQLDEFIRSKKKGILTTGLWKYTRHPNYFGEVTLWWGVWLIVLGTPLGFLAIIGPLTITYLILKVSGIPMAEKRFEGDPVFEAYKAKTSAFFPKFPKG